jgi:hypothetical protein
MRSVFFVFLRFLGGKMCEKWCKFAIGLQICTKINYIIGEIL